MYNICIYSISTLTFANETTAVVHETQLLADLVVDGFILGELVDVQVRREPRQLLVAERFAQESDHLLDFSS